jgi:LmbE family N-acetylglucosaminyl deacetylase
MATIVAFHAHPDDEALLTAGTLAKAARAGHRVVLVFATRGEVGTTGDELASGESLGSRRSDEAAASATAIGAARLEFLPWSDSGLTSSPDGSFPAASFCSASIDEAAARLASVLEEEHADLLIADDRNGGYGHPDHVHVHRVAWAAASATATPLLLATIDREFLSGGIELARGLGVEVPEGFVPDDMSSWYTTHDELTHIVDVSSALDARRASMAAHASQTTGAADTVRTLAVFLGLPDELFAIAFGTEWYALAAGTDLPTNLPDELGELFTPAS